MHLPVPSHDMIPLMPSPSQVPDRHSVPCTYKRQPPLPSQVPSGPQVAGVLAVQSEDEPDLTPAGTNAHSPSEVRRLQALHVSPHEEVQHTPSAQNPVWHSLSQEHESALPLVLSPVPAEHALEVEASGSFVATSARLASEPPVLPPPPSTEAVDSSAFLHAAGERTVTPSASARIRAARYPEPFLQTVSASNLIEIPP